MPSGPYGLIIRQRRQRGAAFFKFLERVMPDQASASGHPNSLTANRQASKSRPWRLHPWPDVVTEPTVIR
ncbi:MAG: hypothetical protein OXI08_07890 [Cyanobacteria bacterium MAG IRC4_bin_6]|nr:hypothetical protein [Cyanobacteria bacterium MAG IRC3_bin_20]MDE0647945.1 hypothetical protein [Cyanobacteria bacterium MAG IRC4_bin_6]